MATQNRYNVGVTDALGDNVGFIVWADNADAAYAKVVEFSNTRGKQLAACRMSQRRDEKIEYNSYFDRNYPLYAVID